MPSMPSKHFYAYAVGETFSEVEEKINMMIDAGFGIHGFPFSHNGKFYQSMSKPVASTQQTAQQALEAFRKMGISIKYKPLPPGPERNQG